jgi:Dynein heavy chain, N-terminal region 2
MTLAHACVLYATHTSYAVLCCATQQQLFDSVSSVVHDSLEPQRITALQSRAHTNSSSSTSSSSSSSDGETVLLQTAIKCTGAVEDWLSVLETEMRTTLQALCATAAAQVHTTTLHLLLLLST